MHTEEEAKKKWCPMSRDTAISEGSYNRTATGKVVASCMCIASECMMWRWVRFDTGRPDTGTSSNVGYCGLTGNDKITFHEILPKGEKV